MRPNIITISMYSLLQHSFFNSGNIFLSGWLRPRRSQILSSIFSSTIFNKLYTPTAIQFQAIQFQAILLRTRCVCVLIELNKPYKTVMLFLASHKAKFHMLIMQSLKNSSLWSAPRSSNIKLLPHISTSIWSTFPR